MRRNKIHRAAVMAAQSTACPSCGYSVSPAEIQPIDNAVEMPEVGDGV